MTRDDIIKMALDAGFCHDINNGIYLCAPMHIERFAALVVAAERERIIAANAPEIEKINAHIRKLEDAVKAEREACAKVCQEYETNNDIAETWLNIVSEVIRARGQE